MPDKIFVIRYLKLERERPIVRITETAQSVESFLFKMIRVIIASFLFTVSNPLKIWIPNTNIKNKLNWDKKDIPKDCDNIQFQAQTEVAAFWDLKKVVVSGLHLPESGDLIFPQNVVIQFRNKEKCSQGRDLKYIRHQVKGWLDPDNWKYDSEFQWLPHSERVPCAGESVIFPPQRTFAVQLPSILVPIGEIIFDNEVYQGDTWSDFLETELGFQFFKGADDLRSIPWRNGVECSEKEDCVCGRSSYTIHDRLYKETQTRVFEEAVCLYAMPKCKPSECYKPVIPEGHCCGICGDVIKLKDNDKGQLNVTLIKSKVEAALEKHDYKKKLKTYVGKTKDEGIQIVVIAENPDDTIESHTFANIIKRKLTEQNFQARISSSGLRFSNYLFNSISGTVFGTFIAVLLSFVAIYYIYLVLPKKKFPSSRGGNPFMFARFDNIVNEENLEIGVEPESQQEVPQAFDNPMYSGSTEPVKRSNEPSSSNNLQLKESERSKTPEATTAKEYVNPVYTELEKTKKLDDFSEHSQEDEDEFNEIKF